MEYDCHSNEIIEPIDRSNYSSDSSQERKPERTIAPVIGKKRGRPLNSKTKNDHRTLGRPKKHISNQGTLNSFVKKNMSNTTRGISCDVGIQTDPLDVDSNDENDESVDDELLPEALDAGNLINNSKEDGPDTDAEEEWNVPDVDEFQQIDEAVASIVEDGVIDRYLKSIQDRLKGGKSPKEYKEGTFWLSKKSPSFILENSTDLDLLYEPRVFLWFPHHFNKNLKCPICKHNRIEVKGFNKNPRARRIIDLQDCFYLMTMRYKCLNSQGSHSFNGYDDGIVKQLDLRIQADFPAILTYRSGISKSLAKLMRPAFQHGVGPHRLSKILRVLHTERYDELQLQYYVTLDKKLDKRGIHSYLVTKSFPEFSGFSDPKGYNGIRPSSSYLSHVYSSTITELRPFMDQMMALLDGIILKGDHSFKIIDHMAKVNGVSTFSCLYTLLNEYEEIRLQVLCHSKKMGHLAPQFVSMMENYRRLGKKLPELFYTDNVIGDQRFLKEVIPSLTKDVVPVEPTKQKQNSDMTHLLKEIKLPKNVDITVFDDTSSIDNACQVILNQLNTEDQLYIGFDCEWVKSSPISLIQVAFNRSVYLFRVHTFDIASFPKKLRDIISSEKIRKIGSNIQSDFTRLARGFECEIPKAEGKIDLGFYCKAKDVVPRRKIQLSQICAIVLMLRLPKTPILRCGNWEADTLSKEQQTYAALDAWVALEIFNAVKDLPPANEKVSQKTAVGTFVAIFPKLSKRIVASGYGYVCDPSEVDSDRSSGLVGGDELVSIKVIKIQIPAMIVDCYSDINGNATLDSISHTLPFHCYVHARCLRTASEAVYISNQNRNEDFREGNTDSTAITPDNNESSTTVPSRIVKDAFHIMQMIRVSLRHGMSKDFSRRFRDAIFVVDPEDKRKVEQYLATKNTNWNEFMVKNSDFILQRVKRFIPPPEKLYQTVKLLFDNYGNAICSFSGKPLFNDDTWKDAASVLEEIRLGHVSDVKGGPPLYTEIGYDKNGLMKYRCCRGTSSVEGSVHMNIVRKFSSYNAGARLTDMVLADYRLYHNINVGSKNRHGKLHQGHYSPWLSQSINTIRIKLGHAPIDDYFCNTFGSSFDYLPIEESFGIVSLPQDLTRTYNIPSKTRLVSHPDNMSFKSALQMSILPVAELPIVGYHGRGYLYKFMAERQNTLLAVTAVHTDQEVKLFMDFMEKQELKDQIQFFANKSLPDFEIFAMKWSEYCREDLHIYYKLPRHLEAFFNILEDRKKYHDSVLLNSGIRNVVIARAQHPDRLVNGPIISLPVPSPPSPTTIARMCTSVSSAPAPNSAPPNKRRPLRIEYRPYMLIPPPTISKARRAARLCAVCNLAGCPGGSHRSRCRNKCGKCQQEACPGKHNQIPCLKD